MACETEMLVGCAGDLTVSYVQDNRLGNVDHEAVADAVEKLPEVFEEGAGGKRIFLKLTFPLILLGFVMVSVLVGVMFVHFAVSSSNAGTSDCPPRGTEAGHECETQKMQAVFKASTKSMMIIFVAAGGSMISWFVMSVCLMCLRASAVDDGFEAVRSRLGELNQEMPPLNFSMRTDAQRVHKVGSAGTKLVYRFFLEITNTNSMPINDAPGNGPMTQGLLDNSEDLEAGE